MNFPQEATFDDTKVKMFEEQLQQGKKSIEPHLLYPCHDDTRALLHDLQQPYAKSRRAIQHSNHYVHHQQEGRQEGRQQEQQHVPLKSSHYSLNEIPGGYNASSNPSSQAHFQQFHSRQHTEAPYNPIERARLESSVMYRPLALHSNYEYHPGGDYPPYYNHYQHQHYQLPSQQYHHHQQQHHQQQQQQQQQHQQQHQLPRQLPQHHQQQLPSQREHDHQQHQQLYQLQALYQHHNSNHVPHVSNKKVGIDDVPTEQAVPRLLHREGISSSIPMTCPIESIQFIQRQTPMNIQHPLNSDAKPHNQPHGVVPV